MGLRSSLRRLRRKVKKVAKAAIVFSSPELITIAYRKDIKKVADNLIKKYGGVLSIAAMFIPVVGWLVSGLIDRRMVELMIKEYKKLSKAEIALIKKMTAEEARKYMSAKVADNELRSATVRASNRERLNEGRLSIINTGIKTRATKMLIGFFFRCSPVTSY